MNPNKDQPKKRVYIAGDWLYSHSELATKFEQHGYVVPYKWWEDRVSHKENVDLMCQEIKDCDLFIFDMRTERFDKHKFGGSHVGCGIALAYGKIIKVIIPENITKPLTPLLTPYIISNEDTLF
jgi:hypothetical protein